MKKILLAFFFIIFSYNLHAQEKIVYLDTNYLLSQSEVGKYVNSKLKVINDKNNEEFKKIEMNIKSSEEKLIKQKNILNKEDYENKIAELTQLRNKAGNEILKHINEILTKYSQDKSISLIIEKKNVVIGKTDLDVTSDILSLLNKKVKKIELN